MTEEARQIVEFLNKDPFQRNYNLISFHSLGPEQLLQLLNDVLTEIDSKNAGDIRQVDQILISEYFVKTCNSVICRMFATLG